MISTPGLIFITFIILILVVILIVTHDGEDD